MTNTHKWKRPSAAQAEQGYLALYVALHSLTTERGGVLHYEQACPVNEKQLLRRYLRGADIPYWLEYVGTLDNPQASGA